MAFVKDIMTWSFKPVPVFYRNINCNRYAVAMILENTNGDIINWLYSQCQIVNVYHIKT